MVFSKIVNESDVSTASSYNRMKSDIVILLN
jgi:hypothetical protein